MRHLLPLFLLGCSPNVEQYVKEKGIVEDDDTAVLEAEYSLSLVLSESYAPAGSVIDYEVIFLDPQGNPVEAEWNLQSDLDPTMFWDSSQLKTTLAGEHNIIAQLEWEETRADGSTESNSYVATAALTINAAAAASIDLELSTFSAQAGELISYTVSAVDRFGNIVSTTEADVDVDSFYAELTPTDVTSTVPNLYTISASMTSIDEDENAVENIDVEVFQILPGPADAIDLIVIQNGDVEKNDTLHSEIIITDFYGNLTDDPWRLWVEGDGNTVVSHQNITFPEEGYYTIYAEVVDNTALMDLHGPFLIDSTGPYIDYWTPERGTWSTAETGTVSGNIQDEWSAVTSATLNGSSLSIDGDGNFMETMNYDFGLNILETEITDADGNTSNDIRSVLQGDFLPKGLGVANGLTVYIGEGENGLGVIEVFGEEMIGDIDIAGLLPSNPVLSEESESCWDPCFWGSCEICITWYSIDLNIGNVLINPATLDIDPRADGTLSVLFSVSGVSIDWWGSGVVAEVGFSGSGDITADAVDVEAVLVPSVSNNILYIDIQEVNTDLVNLNFDMDGWVYDVISFFGLDGVIENEIENALVGAVQGAVEDEIPPLLEDLLQSLEVNQELDLMGSIYSFTGRPSSVTVDEYGLELGLEAKIETSNWIHPDEGLGSLYSAAPTPSWSSNTGMGIGLSLDFLNQMLYQVWGGGLLDLELGGEELGLSGDELDLIFPGATDLRITVDPLLPPVAVSDINNNIELQLGDLYLALHNGPLEDEDVRLELYLSLLAPLELSATAEAIAINLGEPIVYFDVVFPEANSQAAVSAEALMEALIPYLLPMLTDALTEIEIPSISGFSILNVSSSISDNYLQLSGELEIQ